MINAHPNTNLFTFRVAVQFGRVGTFYACILTILEQCLVTLQAGHWVGM